MAFNGSGTFTRLYNWVTDRNASVKIQASRMDAEMDGFATGLSTAICRDGQTTVTANIPFNGKRITSIGDAAAATDAMNRQSGDARYVMLTGTTSDITLSTGSQLRLDVQDTNFTAPSLAFAGDLDTGITRIASATMGVGTNGSERQRWDGYGAKITGSAGVTLTGSSRLGLMISGSTGTSDYSGIDFTANGTSLRIGAIGVKASASTSEMHFGVSSALASAVNVDVLSLTKDNVVPAKPILAPTGSVSLPAYAFSADDSTGIYKNGSALSIAVAGVEEFQIGGTAVTIPNVFNDTTATAANVNVISGGRIRQSTSSRRFKTNIETLEDAAADVALAVRPVWYRPKEGASSDDPTLSYYGFIAEEVAEIDPRLVHWHDHPDEGRVPWGVQYDRFVPHLCNLAQRHDARIAALEGGSVVPRAPAPGGPDRIAALEAELATLKAAVATIVGGLA